MRGVLARSVAERAEFPGGVTSLGFSAGVCLGAGVRFDTGVRHLSRSCECSGHEDENREEGGELHF